MNEWLKKSGISIAIIVGLFGVATFLAPTNTYYVRKDGGTIQQCSGKVDKPYTSSVTNKACAVNHLTWLHPMWGRNSNNRTKLVGGDKVIIGPGEYRFAWDSPGLWDTTECAKGYPFGCIPWKIPSGEPYRPTIITGKEGTKPELWGAERLKAIFNLRGSNNIVISNFVLTDHEGCMAHTGSPPCNRSTRPYGDWSENGIVGADSNNVLLENLDIRGFSSRAIKAGRISNWIHKNVHMFGNGAAGWDSDIAGNNGDNNNSGKIEFYDSSIIGSGCSADYPYTGKLSNCCSQNQSCYGDGLATNNTGGHWLFDNFVAIKNTSDAIDLLYYKPGEEGSVTVINSYFEANAGNAIKSAFPKTVLKNNVLVGNCDYFRKNPEETWRGRGGFSGNCRAGGNPIGFGLSKGRKHLIENNTVLARGDVAFLSGGPRGNPPCDGTESITFKNNIFIGGHQAGQQRGEDVGFYWIETSDAKCKAVKPTFEGTNIVYNFKDDNKFTSAKVLSIDPQFEGVTIGANGGEITADVKGDWDVTLPDNSPYKNLGYQGDILADPTPGPQPTFELVTETFSQSIVAQDGQSFGEKNQLTFELNRNGTFVIDGSGIATQKSDSYLDSAWIRSTDALPDTYKISVVVGDINYGLENIAGIPNDPNFSEGPRNENGVYFIAITDILPDSAYTNDWWHQHRKTVIDVDNNVWGHGMPNPVFMVYFNKENKLVSYKGADDAWQPVDVWINGIHYAKDTFYKVEFEKTLDNYIFRISTESGQLLEEASIPLSEVWHTENNYPDYFVIGEPHQNYYQGSLKIKEITIPSAIIQPVPTPEPEPDPTPDPVPEPDPIPEPEPPTVQGLPLDFFNKPVGTQLGVNIDLDLTNVQSATLMIKAFDIDDVLETRLFINNTSQVLPSNIVKLDGGSLTGTIDINPDLLITGENVFMFEFADDLNGSTGGFKIEDIKVDLVRSADPIPDPVPECQFEWCSAVLPTLETPKTEGLDNCGFYCSKHAKEVTGDCPTCETCPEPTVCPEPEPTDCPSCTFMTLIKNALKALGIGK